MVDIGHLGCVRSGLCCQRAHCAYGAPGEDGTGCRCLETDETERGYTTYRYGRYEWIVANVPDWQAHPAFGGGGNAPLFNPNRAAILAARAFDGRLPSETEIARVFMQAAAGQLDRAAALLAPIIAAHPDLAEARWALALAEWARAS